MKLTSILLIVVAVLATSSCHKVGEDDPSFSLRSRNAKITGTWKLTSYSTESTESSLIKSTTSTTSTNTKTIITQSKNFEGSTYTVKNKTDLTKDVTSSTGETKTYKNGSSRDENVYTINDLTVTFFDDYTYAISYNYTLTSKMTCTTATDLDGNHEETCETPEISINETKYSNNYEGEWMWNGEGKEKKMEVILTTLGGVSGGSIGLFSGLFSGSITKLSNSEIVLNTKMESSRNSMSESASSESSYSLTQSQTWENIDKKPSKDSE